MDENHPLESYETPFFGDNRTLGDFAFRGSLGVAPLVLYGMFGGIVSIAPLLGDFQVPIGMGFSLATPLSSPSEFYITGQRGQSQRMQWQAFGAGQTVLGPVRTHTTGLIDFGVRQGDPLAILANEFVHPGRVSQILGERVPVPGVSFQRPAAEGVVESKFVL